MCKAGRPKNMTTITLHCSKIEDSVLKYSWVTVDHEVRCHCRLSKIQYCVYTGSLISFIQ